MQNQDENIRVLELETREIQRQIDLLRKQVPDKANIESSLVDSQIEVCCVTLFWDWINRLVSLWSNIIF